MKHILILEDLLEVQGHLITELAKLEQQLGEELLVTTYSDPEDVKDIVNHEDSGKYDVIILDRNSKSGGSFHVLDIDRFGPEKIISISSIPQINQSLAKRRVSVSVDKDLRNLSEFASQVASEAAKLLKY